MHNKHTVIALAIILLLPTLLLFTGTESAAGEPIEQVTSWSKGTLDSTRDARQSISEQIDSEGFLHVSYYSGLNNNLMYTSNSGGLWFNKTVDSQSGAGLFNSISIGNNGDVFIAYYDSENHLKIAERNAVDGAWTTNALDQTGDVGKYCSIDIDGNGNGGISYYDATNEKLKFVSYTDGVGTQEVVDGMNPGSTNVGFLVNNVPILTYVEKDTYKLKYAIKNEGVWSFGYVTNNSVGGISSMTVDSYNTIHVAYYNSTETRLVYAKLEGTVWSYDYPDNTTTVSQSLSITADILGKVHISYFNDDEGDLMYATNAGGIWEHETLDSDGVQGVRNAITIDYYANVHIVYLDTTVSTQSKLNHITNSLTTWDIEDVTTDIPFAGENNTMLVDANGVKHIAFSDPNNGSLYYADDRKGVWNITLVDSGGVGQNPDIALDGNGFVYISYYDMTNKHLKMASNSSTGWKNMTIDGSTNNGLYSAISVVTNETIYIIYTTEAMNLKYATGISGDFLINLVDSSQKVSGEVSMISDSNQELYITYFHDNQLWFGRFSGSVWTLNVVDSAYSCSQSTSIEMRMGGSLVISYFASDGDSQGVRLAFGSVGSWSYQWAVKPTIQGPGFSNAVTLYKNSVPLVAYVDQVGPSPLRVSNYYNGIWNTATISENGISGHVSAVTDPAGSMCILYYDATDAMLKTAVQQVTPSVPLSLTTLTGDTFVQLSWSSPLWDGGAPVNDYIIYRGFSPTTMTPYVRVTGNTVYNDTDVNNGITFYYYVRAANTEGFGPATGTVSAVPEGPDDSSGMNIDMTLIIIVAIVAVVAVVAIALILRYRR
jgi:hypothetical protein